ncbi:hypothetical protein HPB49_018382 [Dermacentor silvarum]|uniref:Uncharacterized protein n=1 Tax=Dermacentor silvarum TaxID=543639 RepID=A0ACB8E1T6_DERSI|nr:hypothetical protein HPB49_018382 [Dermacentor silvarum]
MLVEIEGTIDSVSNVSINLAIHDVRLDNRELVLKPRNKDDERACDSCVGRRRKLFPRAECYLLVVGVKDSVSQCNTMYRPRSLAPYVILTSATINTDMYSEYFDDAPVIVIPGKAHPVTQFFVDDLVSENIVTAQAFRKCGSDAVRIVPDVFMHIVEMKPSEAIFCFLPGWNEINTVRAELCERAPAKFNDWILPLHASLRYQEQQKIFANLPADVRKVILSTSLAESTINVDDVVYVVDTGHHRGQRFNPSAGVSLLGTFPTSTASVQQGAGRVGRVQPGESHHLFTQDEFLSWDQFKRPEIQTTDLTTVVLDCKALEGISFLSDEVARLRSDNEHLHRENALASTQQAETIGALRVEVLTLRDALGKPSPISPTVMLPISPTVRRLHPSKKTFSMLRPSRLLRRVLPPLAISPRQLGVNVGLLVLEVGRARQYL